ncbi:MAG: endolytic transglycosylase MltG [Ignavibacteria bacterium]|nr:endolytic transglycosylase MltG [Ignavibacteria bacterium]
MRRKRKRKNKIRNILFGVLIFFVGFITILASLSIYFMSQKVKSNGIVLRIPNNASTRLVVEILNREGFLRPKEFFLPLMRVGSIVLSLEPKSGTYRFEGIVNNFDVLNSLYTGRNRWLVSVTFPEGITLKDFANIAQRKLGIDTSSFLSEARKFALELSFPNKSIEGYLMPETYNFFYGVSAREIIEKLVNTQTRVWNSNFDSIARKKGLSRHFVTTLASIIELESPLVEERKRISGVFYNRLHRKMRLESDPTVQYALNSKRRLRLLDLQVKSEFNTYRVEGLPPGPICSPSVNSIESALFPEEHDYLFFVSVGDGSGRHFFSKTYKEHLKNKKIYKRNLKKKIASSD